MKTILLLALISATFATFASADDFRIWTQQATGKTISAKIIDKKSDNSAARLNMKNGKCVWLKTEGLVWQDRDFVAAWKKMPLGFHFLTVTLSGTKVQKGGYKMINVVARSHDEPLICKVYSSVSDGRPEEFEVASGSTSNLTFKVRHNYLVTLEDEGGELIDEETSRKKTRK
jgi:hypothetical protein